MNWFLFWLLLHIAAAIFAFGPTLVFPLVGSLFPKHPEGLRFGLELNHLIETRLVIPLALSMLISGSALIWTVGVNLAKTPYLVVAIILYLIALGIAFFNQVPATSKLLELTAGGPPPGATPGGPPPPPVQALINRARIGGILLTVLLFIIIFLMVIKPGGIVGGPIFG